MDNVPPRTRLSEALRNSAMSVLSYELYLCVLILYVKLTNAECGKRPECLQITGGQWPFDSAAVICGLQHLASVQTSYWPGLGLGMGKSQTTKTQECPLDAFTGML